MGGAPSVSAPPPPSAGEEFTSALQAYAGGAGQLFGLEQQYQPLYNALQTGMETQNISRYAQTMEGLMPGAQAAQNAAQIQATQGQLANMQMTAPGASAALMASSPQYGQLAGMASAQMGAGINPQLQGLYGNVMGAMPGQVQGFQNLAGQAANQLAPINQQLGALGGQLQAGTGQALSQLGQYQQNLIQNARSDIFNQTKGNVMGALGQLDPLTQQLQATAQQQLALGGNMSPQMAADVAQQERAAYQARGMLQSTGSIGAEIMGQQQMQQQLLQQREQFAAGVSPLVQQQLQQRTANAMGLTQTDIAATQQNYALAGQLAQWGGSLAQGAVQTGAGLQSQIGANLQNAIAQQAGLQGQALGAYQGGITQAGGLMQSALGQQLAQQQLGGQIGQYLTGAQQQNLAGLLGYAPQGAPITQAAAGMNQYGTGGPALFQGLGLLPLTAQNQALGYNAQMGARYANAQSAGAAQGATMGAVGSIAGAAIGGLALF